MSRSAPAREALLDLLGDELTDAVIARLEPLAIWRMPRVANTSIFVVTKRRPFPHADEWAVTSLHALPNDAEQARRDYLDRQVRDYSDLLTDGRGDYIEEYTFEGVLWNVVGPIGDDGLVYLVMDDTSERKLVGVYGSKTSAEDRRRSLVGVEPAPGQPRPFIMVAERKVEGWL